MSPAQFKYCYTKNNSILCVNDEYDIKYESDIEIDIKYIRHIEWYCDYPIYIIQFYITSLYGDIVWRPYFRYDRKDFGKAIRLINNCHMLISRRNRL